MVEWKKLGDIVGRNKGIPITAGQMNELASADGNVRVFAAGSTIADIDEKKLPLNCAYKQPSIIVKSRGYIDFEFYEKPFTHKNEMWSYSFENKQEGKYIYYFLTTQTGFFRKKAKANSVKLPQLSVTDTDNFLIPIPSLSEQERIVGILDTFTASIDNIKAQIEQRRKQYEHYRNTLLTFNKDDDSVEWKTLGEISYKICSGGTPLRENKEFFNGTIPWLRTQEVDWRDVYDTEIKITQEAIAKSSAKLIPENCVIIAMYGATAGKSCINKIPLTTNQACCNLQINDSTCLYKYVYHYVCREYNKLKALGEGSQNNISIQKIKSYNIPIPSLARQQEIVSILDTFEASITNLEAQLEQRQKQYEYYREELLTNLS